MAVVIVDLLSIVKVVVDSLQFRARDARQLWIAMRLVIVLGQATLWCFTLGLDLGVIRVYHWLNASLLFDVWSVLSKLVSLFD